MVGEGFRLSFDYMNGRLTGTVDDESIDRTTDADPRGSQDRSFLRAVSEDAPDRPRSPYDDALRTLELTLAATEALETGEEVVLS